MKRLSACMGAVAVVSLVCVCLGADMTKFTPPDEKTRREAIGDLATLTPELQRAFSENQPTGAFQPTPAPGPHDWLAAQPEEGQTYKQWLDSRPNLPDKIRTTLYLQPIGVIPENRKEMLPKLKAFMEAFFQMPVKMADPIDLKDANVTSRKNDGTHQKQLLTTDILAALKKNVPADAYAVLGMTFTDLYPDPKWNFVFGQALLKDRVGVYSFARYDPKFFGEKQPENVDQLVLERACKVMAHETCHMFGIQHCIYFLCLENGSNSMEETDSRPVHLCPMDLRKLQHAVGFDPAKRAEKLRDFWKDNKNPTEAKWLEARIGAIKGPAK